jgi:hypothetical protein
LGDHPAEAGNERAWCCFPTLIMMNLRFHGDIQGSRRVRCLAIGMASLGPRSRSECYSDVFLFRRLVLEPVWAFEGAQCLFTQRFQPICRSA